MIDFIDRIPGEGKTGRKKITHADGTTEYVTIENADDATVTGTPLDRAAFMALQGFEACSTVFNADGSITETNSVGHTLTTVFGENTITETFVGDKTISKKTTFNSDGSITEEII